MTTFLQIVNSVLTRLRENEAVTVTDNVYVKLIGKFVNDTKRSVEDAWAWSALYTTIPVTTVGGTHTYTLTGSGYRFKIDLVNNITHDNQLHSIPLSQILTWHELATISNTNPYYYAFKGMSGDNVQVVLYPTPNEAETINFHGWVPQVDLVLGTDILTIPSEAVILGAYARALVERGEDGGLGSSEAYGIYKSTLSDQIAIESTRHAENDCWVSN